MFSLYLLFTSRAICTSWKVSRYGAFSGPYFPVFVLNMGKYGPKETPFSNTFHSVLFTLTCLYLLYLLIHIYRPLYYYTNLIKLIKYRKYRNYGKSVSSIDDDYLETATGGVL